MEDQYFVNINDIRIMGPLTVEQIHELVNDGVVTGKSQVTTDGGDNWHDLSLISELIPFRNLIEFEEL